MISVGRLLCIKGTSRLVGLEYRIEYLGGYVNEFYAKADSEILMFIS